MHLPLIEIREIDEPEAKSIVPPTVEDFIILSFGNSILEFEATLYQKFLQLTDGLIVTLSNLFTDPNFKDDIVNPTKLTELNGKVETAQTNLTNAENAYKANRNSTPLRLDVKDKQKILTEKQEILETYLDGKTDKVDVETYVLNQKTTKIIQKTKIKKTFTVTENGLT